MPNVMGREFPYTSEGMAAAEQYSQALGMRDGGMMGFRPVGYQGGGSVPAGYRDGDVVMDEQNRIALIEYLMDALKMNDPSTFLGMSNADLMRAREKVDADALEKERQRQQVPPPAPQMNYGQDDPGMNYGQDDPGMNYGQADPGMNFGPVAMNRGGIMSLREGGLASYGPGGGGVVNQLQDLGGRAEEFASSVQDTIGGGGMNFGPQLVSSGELATGAAPMLGQLRPSPFRQQI
jgi:hypothetical protein